VKEFTKSTIRAGVPFGLAMSVFFYLQIRRPGAIVGGLVAGLLFGIGMTLYERRREKRLRKLGLSPGDMKPTQERTISLQFDLNTAMQMAKSALMSIRKIQSDSIRENGHQVTARTGVTWQSFGERISVEILPTVGGSAVHIISRPKLATTTMDGGKGRENVELFGKALME
jgi:hypothetical protein